jgi:hypothetical protein
MSVRTRFAAPRTLVLALTALLAAGCSDSTGPEEEHLEAAGMQILNQAGTVLASVNAQRQVTGSLSVRAGQEQTLEIFFVDEEGDRFRIEESDAEHSLAWTVANQTIAEIEAHEGHHDLIGKQAGSTTVVFRVMHGGHSDYDSPAIPITVAP